MAEWGNPSNDSRMNPFWFWNGKLEPEEIDLQLPRMKLSTENRNVFRSDEFQMSLDGKTWY